MILSLIPFLIILIPRAFGVSYASPKHKVVFLITYIVASLILSIYMRYQIFLENTLIGRGDYANIKVDMRVPFYKVQTMMLNRDKHLLRRQKHMKKMIAPQTNRYSMITKDEFLVSFKEWLDSTRKLMDYSFVYKSETSFNEVEALLFLEKGGIFMRISTMMKDVFHHKDEIQDESAIDGFIKSISVDRNSSIPTSELKDFLMEVKHEDRQIDEVIDERVDKLWTSLHIDEDGNIDKHKLKTEITNLLEDVKQRRSRNDENQKPPRFKIALLLFIKLYGKQLVLFLFGTCILYYIPLPLILSVQNLSRSVKLPRSYATFVLVPLAIKARPAMALIINAQKRDYTESTIFLEIYHQVIMNNLMVFALLLMVMYFHGLTWHLSVEVLVLVIVCFVMGLLACFNSKFPNWTLFIALPLYPLSILFVYLFHDTF